MSIEKLALSIQYLQWHWGTSSTYRVALRCSFELVQIETGLQGNVLVRDFESLWSLATHTWFKLIWEYLHKYRVTFDLAHVDVPSVRERDVVLMELVVKNAPPPMGEHKQDKEILSGILYITNYTRE